jgi:hypothetical protein
MRRGVIMRCLMMRHLRNETESGQDNLRNMTYLAGWRDIVLALRQRRARDCVYVVVAKASINVDCEQDCRSSIDGANFDILNRRRYQDPEY